MKPIRWRAIFVSLLTVAAVYAIAPTIIYFAQPLEIRNDEEVFRAKVPTWLPQSHIKLGLDLQGGVQLALGVNTEEAVENKLNRLAVELSRWSADAKVSLETAFVTKGTNRLTAKLAKDSDIDPFHAKFMKEFPLLTRVSREGNTLYYAFKDTELERIKKSAFDQAERVVRTRVDQWGVTEAMINRRSDGSILVQLPGFRNPQKARELLGRTAMLEFKIVDDEFRGFDALPKVLPEGVTKVDGGRTPTFQSEDREKLVAFLKASVPVDRQLLFSREQLGDGTQNVHYRFTTYIVHAATELIGDDVMDAQFIPSGGMDHKPNVQLTLTAMGGKRFGEVTGANVNKRLAIILDGVVEQAPVIQQKIAGGIASITLGGSRGYQQTIDEGTQLALILKSGAIPATITVLEQRQVGASLGPELANQGIKGILLGLFLVLVFMIIYYQRPGMIACLALILNAVFLLAIQAGFGFALTLPGIAGFVLTLGMAVDANVLINERIRQEIREGKHPRLSVQAGFKKAFWTIIDSHVTTLIAAVVLLETNPSGPIRGFAVTLIIGLLVSLFTSLTCSHLFFDIALTRIPDKRLKAWLSGKDKEKPAKPRFNFDFLRAGRIVTFAIIGLSILTLSLTAARGLNFGVDFAGGTEVMIGFKEDVTSDEIHKVADNTGLQGVALQALEGGRRQYLIRFDEATKPVATQGQDAAGHSDASAAAAAASDTFMHFKDNLVKQLSKASPEVLRVDFVGPQVGKELRLRGIISVLFSILAILLYIALRFDMRFAPGAAIKMFLDVFIMLGFYVFFWRSFDLVAVAAFLTAVGYSVNDTIVIYDRIRENLADHPRRSLRDNINIALNETLSRSINTSATVVISLIGILIFGSGQIWDFAMAMTIGVFAATVSSTFVATSVVVWFEAWRNRRRPVAATPAGTLRRT